MLALCLDIIQMPSKLIVNLLGILYISRYTKTHAVFPMLLYHTGAQYLEGKKRLMHSACALKALIKSMHPSNILIPVDLHYSKGSLFE